MGKVPDDLPDTDLLAATGPPLAAIPVVEEELNSDTNLASNRPGPTITSKGRSHPNPPLAPPSPMTDSDLSQHDPMAVKSDIPALDDFPVPPVHFPPRLQRRLTSSLDGPVAEPSSYGRQMTSHVLPIQEAPDLTTTGPGELAVATATQTPSPATNKRVEISTHLSAPSRSDPCRTSSPTDLSPTASSTDATEFGIRQSYPPPSSGSPGSSTLPKGSPRNSGVVLAMRNRFAQNVS